MCNAKTNIKARKNNSTYGESFSLAYSRPSVSRLRLTIGNNMSEIQTVELNGELFHKKGVIHEIIRVAAIKFTHEHFKEVDALIGSGYGPTSACNTVSEKYGFNNLSFRQQYYKRHANVKVTSLKKNH